MSKPAKPYSEEWQEVRILVPLDRLAKARELLGADGEPDDDEHNET